METVQGLPPAADVIAKLGGIDATAAVVKRHRSVVNRWLLPRESGGTGGTIPPKHRPTILAHAREKRIALTLADLAPELVEHISGAA